MPALKALQVLVSLDADAGGPPVSVRHLVNALREQDIHCEIATTHGGRYREPPLAVPGTQVHTFSPTLLAAAWNAHSPSFGRFLRRNAGRFDLIHVHEIWHYPGYVACTAARRAGTAAMISTHGTLAAGALQRKRIRKNLYLPSIQRHQLNAADAVHAITTAEADDLRACGIRAPVFQAPNGVSAAFIGGLDGATAAPLFARHPQLADSRIVLFFGRIIANKGLDRLARCFIALAARFLDAKLLVAGPARDDTQARCAAMLADAGLAQRAVFTGMLSGDDMLAALIAADVFVLPSQFEVCSNAILEALAARVPVVISESCNFPEVADREAGLVVPLDDDMFTRALETLLADAQLRGRMGENGRRMIDENYSWPVIGSVFAAVYRDICAAKAAGRNPRAIRRRA